MAQQTPIRDQKRDHLITPQNSVLAMIDYQPEQFRGVHSKPKDELMMNAEALGKVAREFSLPTILSTVGVQKGVNHGTVQVLREILSGVDEIDRTTLNAWEDQDFHRAVIRLAKKKIIFAGLWTEVCVAFPAMDAVKDNYDVYVVADAIGGITSETHERAMQRMIHSGVQPITVLALACELQRDWARGNGDALRSVMNWYFGEQRRLQVEHHQHEGDALLM